ncbi:hypothetical protein TNCV_334881 [Trichonephila clavipes]|nr:hypothetical protein TNCV_334881 [Trichonephila clavipes]
MVLKANDRRTSCRCHDEFRGPRSDYVRQRWLEIYANLQSPKLLRVLVIKCRPDPPQVVHMKDRTSRKDINICSAQITHQLIETFIYAGGT